MIGRMEEIAQLERLYESGKFEFLAMYGRRRIGKTTILREFSKQRETIFFSAQEKNDAMNLQGFSKLIQEHFDGGFISPFQGWNDAFAYLTRKGKASERRTVLIIDEFPFLAKQNPSIKSVLQHTIDHDWAGSAIMLVLCGSSVSFMLNEVMGYESPLYGRVTSTMEVRPFDYLESAEFFPGWSPEDKLIAYGILGGVPRYLEAFDPDKTLKDNIVEQILRPGAYLHDEPLTMLRSELREPSVYNSILEAISRGDNRVTQIASRTGEESTKCGKYLAILQTLRLAEKNAPCGDLTNGKKGIYRISDNYYRFWYRFVFSNEDYHAMLGVENAADEILDGINDYMGPIFEDIGKQYMTRLAKEKKLPFTPYHLGKWWGTNPTTKAQDDVDVLALDKTKTKAIFCECKFRNRPMPMEEYDDLATASLSFPKIREKHFIFISKSGFTGTVAKRAEEEGALLVGMDDLFS